MHLAQCSILPGRGRSRLALPVRVVVLRRKVHLSIAQRTLGARVSKHEATNDTTGRRRVVGARSKGPPRHRSAYGAPLTRRPPHTTRCRSAGRWWDLARRVRPRSERTGAALGFVADAIRGSNEATAAGRSRDSPRAGVATEPQRGPARHRHLCPAMHRLHYPSLPGDRLVVQAHGALDEEGHRRRKARSVRTDGPSPSETDGTST